MTVRMYPTNATRGGAFTLTGAGSANDILTFPFAVQTVVQNDTAATIYVAVGSGASSAATQGDEAVLAGQEFVSTAQSSWVSIYGTAGTHVNGTVAAAIVVYGLD